jgi:hypothetical protein
MATMEEYSKQPREQRMQRLTRPLTGRAGVTRRRGVEQERWFAFPTF